MTRSIWRPEYTVPNGPVFALLNHQELISQIRQSQPSLSINIFPKPTKSQAKIYFLDTHFSRTYTLAAGPSSLRSPSHSTASDPSRSTLPLLMQCRKGASLMLCAGRHTKQQQLEIFTSSQLFDQHARPKKWALVADDKVQVPAVR